MTRQEIVRLVNGGPLPVDGFFARPMWELGFQTVGDERRLLTTLTERARAQNPGDPRLNRANLQLEVFAKCLSAWLKEWEPPHRPN